MKIFVTDYDGTLFIDEMNLKINKNRIISLHNKGFIIIISTGRSYSSIKKQMDKYQIYYDYLHCADGSIIYDKFDNLINFYQMDHNIVESILSFAYNLTYEEIQICYPKEYRNEYDENDNIAGVNIVFKPEFFNQKILNTFLDLKSKYPHYNFLYYDHIKYIYLCVKSDNVDKAKAITFMQELLNIEKEDIYVIGDSNNDIEMIKEYNGMAIINDNLDIQKASKKQYHQVYEFIDDIIDNN